MAHRCPYCREEGKEVHGRLILIILLIIGLWFAANRCNKNDATTPPDKNNQVEVYKKQTLSDKDRDKKLLKKLKEIGIE